MPATCEIPLSRGKVAVVDEADVRMLSAYKWHAFFSGRKWYARASPEYRRSVSMHRLLMGAGAGQMVDHRDGDGLNNTRTNLRFATAAENIANSAVRKNKRRSKYKGVFWAQSSKKWFARLMRKGQIFYARNANGTTLFADEVEAAAAFNELAVRIDGEYARVNTL